jgi:hypothetical protein
MFAGDGAAVGVSSSMLGASLGMLEVYRETLYGSRSYEDTKRAVGVMLGYLLLLLHAAVGRRALL